MEAKTQHKGVVDAQGRTFQKVITNWCENTDKIQSMREIGELDPQDLG